MLPPDNLRDRLSNEKINTLIWLEPRSDLCAYAHIHISQCQRNTCPTAVHETLNHWPIPTVIRGGGGLLITGATGMVRLIYAINHKNECIVITKSRGIKSYATTHSNQAHPTDPRNLTPKLICMFISDIFIGIIYYQLPNSLSQWNAKKVWN